MGSLLQSGVAGNEIVTVQDANHRLIARIATRDARFAKRLRGRWFPAQPMRLSIAGGLHVVVGQRHDP